MAARRGGALVVASALAALSLAAVQGHEVKSVALVEIPDGRKPVFPEACVICDRPKSEALEMVLLSDEHSRVELYLYGMVRKPGQGTLLAVPMHASCARGVRNGFLKWLLLTMAIAAAVSGIGVAARFGAFWSLLAALVVATVLASVRFSQPVPMEFNHHGGRFFLLFKERSYAERVARLNGAQARRCTNAYSSSPLKSEPFEDAGQRK